ncbi:hypothetical protein [uncultured Brachyspira sp.]|uniref:hypothetical protein n=1 Tax=uncultured Brachyspira sp. TaxID=221953 RepID=UPI002595A9BC|nr:hypothetical protein [uncultured Brachyspira sp.]
MDNAVLGKPTTYNEVKSQQPENYILAEDINQIIANIEVIKGGSSSETPVINIKSLNEKADDTITNLNNEIQNRTNKDSELKSQIDRLNESLTNESNTREETDTSLQTQITELNQSLVLETKERKEADASLQTQITELNQSLVLETKERKEADAGLQNQINDLNNNKQNNLIAGYNINIEDDVINLKGGLSKDYVVGNEYRVNDFIFHDNRLYRVNSIFTATSFEEDKKTLTLISSNDTATIASEVAYNNNNSNLESDNIQDAIDEIVTKNSDANNSLQEQLKNLINSLMNKIHPIGSYYIQLSKPDGTFDDTEAPSKLWEGTVWKLLYNTESIFLRTEGSLSKNGRSNGIQGDAGRNATGSFYLIYAKNNTSGVFYDADQPGNGSGLADYNLYWQVGRINMDLSRAYTTANEFRVRNRLIRIYKRIS